MDNNILQACICGWAEVLGEEYKAVLYLAEKKTDGQHTVLSSQSMDIIFNKAI